MKHANNGACDRCLLIFNKYPNFHEGLKSWFLDLQSKHPEAHISCAGRGHDEQEELFLKKATRARYGESAHNWNVAIDVFEMGGDATQIYERVWFRDVLAPLLPKWLCWYGSPNAPFYELPHIEVDDWRKLRSEFKLRLVEPYPVG